MLTDFIFKGIDFLFKKSQNPTHLMKLNKCINKVSDISYGDNENEKFDLYYKDDSTKATVIMIHGGGFVAGDKKYRTALSYYYVNNCNINLININYVMSDKCFIIDSIKSLVKGLNYIVDNSEKLMVDTTRIMLTGDSSGAYFAAYLSELSVNDELQKQIGVNLNLKVKCVFLNCGAYSFKEFLKNDLFGVPKELLYRCTGEKNIEDYRFNNVLNIEDILTNRFPRCFVCDSKYDFICGGQGSKLIEYFEKLKIDYISYFATTKKAGHVFQLNWKSHESKVLCVKVIDFINDSLIK